MQLKHYPLLDKGADISGLEPFDFILMIGISFLVSLIAFLFIHIYAAFILVLSFAVSFIVIRKMKTNKAKGYIARQLFFKYFRRYHKIY